MKRQILVLTVVAFTTFISCSKMNNKNVTVIKDCTGSYLRFNDEDYQICNIEIVANYDNGSKVESSFKKIDNCELNYVVCLMAHKSEGLINVTKIE
jgi:hypothetical protein